MEIGQLERDSRSVKCPECGGHIMLTNSITFDSPADAQYRPIFGMEEGITLRGYCISKPGHHCKLKGVVIINEIGRNRDQSG